LNHLLKVAEMGGSEDIVAVLRPTLPSTDQVAPCEQHEAIKKKPVYVVSHAKGQYYFIASPNKRYSAPAEIALPMACLSKLKVTLTG
jgi:hypothetical protein